MLCPICQRYILKAIHNAFGLTTIIMYLGIFLITRENHLTLRGSGFYGIIEVCALSVCLVAYQDSPVAIFLPPLGVCGRDLSAHRFFFGPFLFLHLTRFRSVNP